MAQESSIFLIWTHLLPQIAPKFNPCATKVSSVIICRNRKYRGYVSPGWCTWLWTVINSFCVRLEDSSTKIVRYQYARHISGPKDYPTCAYYALHCTNRENGNQHQEATRAVLEIFYMDDLFGFGEDPWEGSQLIESFGSFFHIDVFKQTKFVSNVPNLADQIGGSAQSNPR